MKVSQHIFCVLVILAFVMVYPRAQERAQENEQPPPPPKYQMELVRIFGSDSPEFIFVVGKIGFKSVDSLKEFVGSLPAGSTIEWAPGCVRMGGEPLLSSDPEMEDFKAFCAAKNINFILVRSG